MFIVTARIIVSLGELVHTVRDNIRFVSIEPIHERINHDFRGLDWIIIGAETGHRQGKIVPEKEWISEIIERARARGLPVYIKDNVRWSEEIREFPFDS